MGALLAGCGDGSGRRARADAPTAAEQAALARTERSLRASAAVTSRELLARYEQVVKAHPATAAGLSPLRDAVRAHAEALSAEGGTSHVLPRTRTTDAASALKELAAAERHTADAHTATLLKAPPELARLLASVAAAGAAHAYLLTELAKETTP